jgi:NADPH:quinone reductase-like Zn-dependent oxidoreductase
MNRTTEAVANAPTIAEKRPVSVTPTTMKAVRIHKYGGPDTLQYEDAPRPQPKAGEVLIRVEAAGVNPVDWKIRAGYLKDHFPRTFPIILGLDLSGIVEDTGPGVSRFRKGDEVYSSTDMTRDGSYAEYVVVDESVIAFKPRSLDHAHAAAVPVAALTAWQALFDTAGLEPGQRILIHGGSGGVGHFAVQLANWKGAHVIATASGKNQEWLRQLGAHETIDYSKQRFEEGSRNLDVVLDTIGGETQERSWQTLKRGGILVALTQPPSSEKAQAHGVRGAILYGRQDGGQLTQLAKLIDAGKLKPMIDRILPVSDARLAHELSQAGHSRGKIVLRIH